MVHLQATYGRGMPSTASAAAQPDLFNLLKRGWEFIGEVNKMRAYSRAGQALCAVRWQAFGEKKQSLRVFAGAQNKANLDGIAADLKLQWN